MRYYIFLDVHFFEDDWDAFHCDSRCVRWTWLCGSISPVLKWVEFERSGLKYAGFWAVAIFKTEGWMSQASVGPRREESPTLDCARCNKPVTGTNITTNSQTPSTNTDDLNTCHFLAKPTAEAGRAFALLAST